MKKLCLESNENGSSLIITGDVDSMFSNRRAARYLKDRVKFDKTINCSIITFDSFFKKINIKSNTELHPSFES